MASSSNPAERPSPAADTQKVGFFGGTYDKKVETKNLSTIQKVASAGKMVLSALLFIPASLTLPLTMAFCGFDLPKGAMLSVKENALKIWNGEAQVVKYTKPSDVTDEIAEPEENGEHDEYMQLKNELTDAKAQLKEFKEDLKSIQTNGANGTTIKATEQKIKDARGELAQKSKEMKKWKLMYQQPKAKLEVGKGAEIFNENLSKTDIKNDVLAMKREEYRELQEELAESKTLEPELKGILTALDELRKLMAKKSEIVGTEERNAGYQVGIWDTEIQDKIAEIDNHKLGLPPEIAEKIDTTDKSSIKQSRKDVLDIVKGSKKEKEIKAKKTEIDEAYKDLRTDVEKLAQGSKIKAKIDGYENAESKKDFLTAHGQRNYDPQIRQSIANYVKDLRKNKSEKIFESDDGHLYIIDSNKGGFIFIPNGIDEGTVWKSTVCFMHVYNQKTGETRHDAGKIARIAKSFMAAHGKIEEWKGEMAEKVNKENPGMKLTAKDIHVHEFVLDFKTENCYALPNGYDPRLSLSKQGIPVKLGDEVWGTIHKILDDKETEDKQPLNKKASFADNLPPTSHRGEGEEEEGPRIEEIDDQYDDRMNPFSDMYTGE